jgi:hypothetical protein
MKEVEHIDFAAARPQLLRDIIHHDARDGIPVQASDDGEDVQRRL